ncbi:MAG: hypothetical protein C0467_19990 [Planctomycetaceae bacterium]|nr:hypothetical protein [Planctomycetaceae bacterium]
MLAGDLVLLEASRAVVEIPGGLNRKWCVLDGTCIGQTEPVYGAVTSDEKRRMMFTNGRTWLRLLDDHHTNFAALDKPPSPKQDNPSKSPIRRRVRIQEQLERRATEMETDPWFTMPAFAMSQVLAVQLMMIRF